MLTRHVLTVLALAIAACRRSEANSSDHAPALLESVDTVAIFNAGVDAYQSERFGEARAYWQCAADLGASDAASNLGFLLYHGLGGPPDSTRARLLWEQAMTGRGAEAHRHVAQAILDGDRVLGTVSDGLSHAVAAQLLGQASDRTKSDAVARDAALLVGSFREQLMPEESARAERRGQDWAQRYPAP